MQFSLSAYQAWQRCEQKYEYSYVRRLRPLAKAIAPQRGSIIHDYLSSYYDGVRTLTGHNAHFEAHQRALAALAKYDTELAAAMQTSYLVGDEEAALEYQNLMPLIREMCERYYVVHGRDDASRYLVLKTEERISLPLAQGIVSNGVLDLLLEEQERGLIVLVEHKTTTSVPDSQTRLRDFQTLLYAEKLRRMNIDVDAVLWNYIRTKEPTEPHVLKDGRLSRAKNIDTTWHVYQRAIAKLGHEEDVYAEVKERLIDRETEVFFPRFEAVIVADASMLLEDYAVEAKRARQAVLMWQHGRAAPVRTLSRDCSFCEYKRLCEAAITGGDVEDVIRLSFKEPHLKEVIG